MRAILKDHRNPRLALHPALEFDHMVLAAQQIQHFQLLHDPRRERISSSGKKKANLFAELVGKILLIATSAPSLNVMAL
jgi:hypothetical protein